MHDWASRTSRENPDPGVGRAAAASVWDQHLSKFSAGHDGMRRSGQHRRRQKQDRRMPAARSGDGAAPGRRRQPEIAQAAKGRKPSAANPGVLRI